MRKIFTLFSLLLIGTNSLVFSQDAGIVPGNLLIMLNSDADAIRLSEEFYYLNSVPTGLKPERVVSKSMHIYLFDFNASTINATEILNAVKKDPSVKIAQFNHTFKERIIPNDPQFGVMWDMNNTGQVISSQTGVVDADIDAPEAWNVTTGGLTSLGDTIVVAVIDGGFDLTQQDLNFWKNYKEIPNNGIDDDNNGYIDDHDGWDGAAGTDNLAVASHGTHVCGTVGARGNNSIGVTGVNWNVKVMPVSYGSGGSFEANVVASYAYVRDQRRLYNQSNGAKGAFVVSTNSSFGVDLGMPSNYPLWCAMYDSLGAVGILSAGATANNNYNVDTQGDIPTACPSNWLITVTNTTNTDTKYTAGYGANDIDLGSPGTNITSTLPSNGYGTMTGTSMATPHVAGTVALMYSVPCSALIANYKTDPAGVALIVKDSLLNATDPIAALSGITVTGGRLNLYGAVRSMQNYCIKVTVPENGTINESGITSIYPNPTSNLLHITYNSNESVDISIVNVLGQEVYRMKANNNSKGIQHCELDLSSIERGIYFVRLIGKEEKSAVTKIILN